MNRQKIEIIAIVILIIIFGFCISSMIKKMSKGAKKVSSETAGIKSSIVEAKKTNANINVETEIIKWGRDPFLLTDLGIENKKAGISLNGIIWNGPKSLVIINDELYKIGDKINDIQIVDIKKDSVVIKENGEVQEINLGRY